MTTSIGNEMILASAGSGKTYALTNRFVKLLALGVEPQKLIALTFTRKAAAEFLDEILRKLAKAAQNPEFASQIREQIEIADFDSKSATALLRQVVDQLHLLSLGTLDSFFNRVLRCFPAEFGLSSDFEVMEPHEAQAARREVFARLFQDRELHEPFAEAFKQATFGVQEKQLVRTLDGFVGRHHQLFLQAPDRALWGEETTIWPEGCRWLRGIGIGDVDEECEALLARLGGVEFDKRAWKMWEDFVGMVRKMRPGRALPPPKTLQERLFQNYAQIHEGGPFEVALYKKHYVLGREVCAHLARVLDYLMYCEVYPNVMQTRGIHDVLAAYEARYHDRVRRAGKLGFDDIQLLLSGALQSEHARPQLSLEGAETRLNMEYRLDGQFDHWLLDEFQDTSVRQWQVIQNLADEVIQDFSGQRSYFYVGDVKQAIFGWRGGDSRLFHDIYEHYGSESIAKREMNSSFRSAPVILDAVNRIFGQREVFDAMFPAHGEFVERWFASWEDHVANHHDRDGFVQLVTLPKGGWDDEESPAERRIEVVAEILRELAPQEKNLTCAVLVRRNETAARIAEYVRAHTDAPVVVEGDTLIGSDHPVAASFLALLQLAAHPGDSLAWKHLCMTPALPGIDWDTPKSMRKELVESTIDAVHDRGFTGAFEDWLARLRSGGFEPDAFAGKRIEQLRQATREFDLSGNRAIGDFVRYAQGFVARETPARGVVQIMTIHKSKGLGFDAVIVAEIESAKDGELTDIGCLGLVAHESGEGLSREIEWVLNMPRKLACELDPTLGAARLKLENEAAFQELCVLYVALTRAKFANYVVCTKPSGRPTMRGLIRRAVAEPEETWQPAKFGGQDAEIAFQAGAPDWHENPEFAVKSPVSPEHGPNVSPLPAKRRFSLRRREMPSSAADDSQESKPGASFVFLPGTIRAAEYGTRVHELFEAVPWLDGLSNSELRARLNQEIDESDAVHRQARDEVLTNLLSPKVAAVFERNNFGADPVAWLEKRFELIHGGKWISGTFDRVVLSRDAMGSVAQAVIFDFKTNKVRTDEEIREACSHYAPQLAIYRIALSKLLGIGEPAVTSNLIFTRLAKVVEVSDALEA